MKTITITIGSLMENTYICFDEETRAAVVIDPGDMAQRVLGVLAENELTLSAILLTHGHYDHTGAVNAVKEAANAPVYAHKAEEAILVNPQFSYQRKVKVEADTYLEDGDVIPVGNGSLRLIYTPGHTVGSCCYYSEKDNILFSGDTLFHESVGRHDFPTGSHEALMNSIKTKLFTLPGETAVYPGHEEATTIAHEKARNPFVR